ncbi:nucleotide-diphospho-sugar transferase [Penicillium sp. IBT 16267x]|nr:nucleotide-diphospho-sugar transferase [Penicillium sp. IBT 16267x]
MLAFPPLKLVKLATTLFLLVYLSAIIFRLTADLDSNEHSMFLASQKSSGMTSLHESAESLSIDWSRFAYVQYATNSDYLCNAVMMFERLHQSEYLSESTATSSQKTLLQKARDEYNVTLKPVELISREGGDSDATLFQVTLNHEIEDLTN